MLAFLAATLDAVINESWLGALFWFMMGITFLPATLLWGIM